jgi:hypothetical protein
LLIKKKFREDLYSSHQYHGIYFLLCENDEDKTLLATIIFAEKMIDKYQRDEITFDSKEQIQKKTRLER